MKCAVLVVAAFVALGCKAEADERNEIFDLPSDSLNGGGTMWESSPWAGSGVEWVAYRGASTVAVHHTLGRVPMSVTVFLSFNSTGEAPSAAAGDLASIGAVTDDLVEITNNTDGDYYIRIVLQ